MYSAYTAQTGPSAYRLRALKLQVRNEEVVASPTRTLRPRPTSPDENPPFALKSSLRLKNPFNDALTASENTGWANASANPTPRSYPTRSRQVRPISWESPTAPTTRN